MLGYVVNIKLQNIFILVAVTSVIYFLIQVYISELNSPLPILVWWTSFDDLDEPRVINCRDNFDCFITGQRRFRNNSNFKAFLFYGSNIKVDDFPHPRAEIPWAIYHEESPKNLPIFLYKETQDLFNITSTFSRFSDMPITFQYLNEFELIRKNTFTVSLEKKNEMLTKLAPILYIQSDCDTPIQRDLIVQDLMEYIQVDSYGPCLNNKPLPEVFKLNGTYELYDDSFMRFVAKYKFILAIENAKCYDYVTEKLWRPLIVGSIPIYLGATSIKDWLPNNDSAILIDDFPSIQELANHIHLVNLDDDAYESYLKHKMGVIENRKFVDAFFEEYDAYEETDYDGIPSFECFVCKSVHTGEYMRKKRPTESIYDCEMPTDYNGVKNSWKSHWEYGKEASKALRQKYN